MNQKTVDVIIPTYRPGETFQELIAGLLKQTCPPRRILVMNTDKECWDGGKFDKAPFLEGERDGVIFDVKHISRDEFDHGGTRAQAAAMCRGDVLLFMTQDAMPADDFLIENLVKAMEREQAAAAYARQLPARDCHVLERYTRGFNYGEKSMVKSAADLPHLGIKTYFCSNVCAAYDRAVYEKNGGFETRTIFNEDMIFAAGLIKAGYRVAYAADAKVIHSHNYSGFQQFHRNFDLAVSQADHPEIFEAVPSESEGIRMVKQSASYLWRSGKFYFIPKLIWQSGCKYLGYLMGKRYRKLPSWLVKKCSMNENYWKKINF